MVNVIGVSIISIWWYRLLFYLLLMLSICIPLGGNFSLQKTSLNLERTNEQLKNHHTKWKCSIWKLDNSIKINKKQRTSSACLVIQATLMAPTLYSSRHLSPRSAIWTEWDWVEFHSAHFRDLITQTAAAPLRGQPEAASVAPAEVV